MYYDGDMASRRKRGRPPQDDILTKTEWSIVHAAQHGMTTREIARRRGVSFDAVKFHIENAMAKLGISNRQALRRWFRVPQGSALGAQTATGGDILMIGQISRSVRNIQLSEAWYRDVLKIPHLFTVGTFAFFDCGGVRLYLFQADTEPTPESIIYFSVGSIQEGYETLRGRGVEFINPPHLIHRHPDGAEEWMAFFKDLEGRSLAIISKVEPPV